ncbi:MAG: hypothetical protein R2722_05180 [Tessaracoccus sp.]
MTEVLFPVRGVGYDAGVVYDRDFTSRPVWDADETRRDMRAIGRRLGCNAVLVMATDIDRLMDTSRIAREEGLAVWVQPRLFDASRSQVTEYLATVAEHAEALRREYGEVSLNIGCELSLSVRGFTPGRTFIARIASAVLLDPPARGESAAASFPAKARGGGQDPFRRPHQLRLWMVGAPGLDDLRCGRPRRLS